ncbi:GNAT family N-acetyltransferase [Candidatus Soleaferrea massiliensis]|uniref:GNAT family N-acetyltransferase n=1 Tax=Candidatus Soleaferrea massiliensis TaxID=1470354 RepID=UPI00069366A6|nr:GNAT family N-acetyltransferase [Candidatus Soleaferrea massiliensis]
MQFHIHTADCSHPDFIRLVELLDAGYYEQYGAVSLQYQPFNTLEDIRDVILIYDGAKAVACGGIRRHDEDTAEVKRVFVHPDYRRQGLGSLVMRQLEKLAFKRGYRRVILETGKDMLPAVKLYTTLGYCLMEPFGPYVGDELVCCMEKMLAHTDEARVHPSGYNKIMPRSEQNS